MVTPAPTFIRPTAPGKAPKPQHLVGLPDSPNQVQEGMLAELYAELQRRQQRAGAQAEVVRRLEIELAAHRFRVENAERGPDDAHYLAIAAAATALPIVQRKIDQERAELIHLVEGRNGQQSRLDLAWNEVEALKQYCLSGGEIPEEHGVKLEGDALLRRIEELVGPLTWSD